MPAANEAVHARAGRARFFRCLPLRRRLPLPVAVARGSRKEEAFDDLTTPRRWRRRRAAATLHQNAKGREDVAGAPTATDRVGFQATARRGRRIRSLPARGVN